MHARKIWSQLAFSTWGTNQSIIRSFVGLARKKKVSPKIIAKTLQCSPDGLFINFWRIGCAGPEYTVHCSERKQNAHESSVGHQGESQL